ncbi:hypothetical protein EEL32_18130 [Brevibacillus laterosporus]|uniref:Uncharacterized protein n=1 Tax=Brevibacillus laterosporus TaxID=1465 RepID=A0A502I9P5_BRELA|nr:hypothetical protein [Brevibacillus laterosporus]QDX94574.1 hypothetical protein EEL30_21220 [Brevibacillus laterosporus]RAP30852.1 hypothetical protein C2W64_00019 [Brevibacillus laterosporus]TPG68461.1 hypothetical protein EEL31_07970 [Brevibacillus laterosporus]TPG83025.1 hypothetical protein EEL32_18130 [Brevibacillus laterosporus]
MKKSIKKIWIEREEFATPPDVFDDNTDVIITFSDNTRWIASFFTYQNIESLRKQNQETGEKLHGTFYWSSDMVLIDNTKRETIEKVVNHLIESNWFDMIFSKISDDN